MQHGQAGALKQICGIACSASHDQIRRAQKDLFRVSVIDRNLSSTGVVVTQTRVARQMGDRDNARVLQQLEQHGVSAQIEGGNPHRRGCRGQRFREQQRRQAERERRARTAAARSRSTGAVISHDIQASVML